MTTIQPKSERGRRLASTAREDHPAAAPRTCRLNYDHTPHPWGPIADRDEPSLTWWCKGRDRSKT